MSYNKDGYPREVKYNLELSVYVLPFNFYLSTLEFGVENKYLQYRGNNERESEM